MHTYQTLGNIFQSEKDLFYIKKKTITNAPKQVATQPNCFSRAKKPIVKATKKTATEVANQTVKIVHSERNAAEKQRSSKR